MQITNNRTNIIYTLGYFFSTQTMVEPVRSCFGVIFSTVGKFLCYLSVRLTAAGSISLTVKTIHPSPPSDLTTQQQRYYNPAVELQSEGLLLPPQDRAVFSAAELVQFFGEI